MTFCQSGWTGPRLSAWRRQSLRAALFALHLLEVHLLRRKREVRVGFIICGTQKGGTTALYEYLKPHPEICMAAIKETHFFDRASPAGSRRPCYALYHACFRPQPGHRILGEATPNYMYHENTARLLHEYNPALKLIFVLRDPAERAYSHWNMNRARHHDARSFAEAIGDELAQRQADQVPRGQFAYLSRGFYLTQLGRFWSHFPKEQMLLLNSDTLRDQPQEALAAVCRFLGVAPLPAPERVQVHAGSYASLMAPQDRRLLVGLYEAEIRGLEKALNWDCSAWLQDSVAVRSGVAPGCSCDHTSGDRGSLGKT